MPSLTISLATRGRPALLRRTIETTLANIRDPETMLMIAVDDDDRQTIDEFVKTGESEGHDKAVLCIKPREDDLGSKYNQALVYCPADVYLVMVDYAPHITPGFDRIILEAARTYPDDICCVFNHRANLSFSGINAVTARMAELMGGIYPTHYPFWYIDHHLGDIAEMTGRFAFADVRIDTSARPGTQNKRDVPFWCEFFTRSSQIREDIARNIIGRMDVPGWQKEALIRNFPWVRERSEILNRMVADQEAHQPEMPDDDRHRRLRRRANDLLLKIGRPPLAETPRVLAAAAGEITDADKAWADGVIANRKPTSQLPAIDRKPGFPIRAKFPRLSGAPPNYSKVLYPDPPSHDFLTFLMTAEVSRRYHKSAEPLTVRLVTQNGQLGVVQYVDYSIMSRRHWPCGVSRGYSDRMIEHVLRPAMAMLGVQELPSVDIDEVRSLLEVADAVEYDHHDGPLTEAARFGCELPTWTPAQWAADEAEAYLGGRRPIVITLREVEHQPERNSNLEAWLKFAASIKNDYDVLIVRDTAKSDEPLPGFETWPRASDNSYIKVALYSHALVNLLVMNGPIGWIKNLPTPYLAFKPLVPALPSWEHGTPEGWWNFSRLRVGQSYPWATSSQRIVWKDDTFENILGAFDELTDELE